MHATKFLNILFVQLEVEEIGDDVEDNEVESGL
jgi:hypothetical protein